MAREPFWAIKTLLYREPRHKPRLPHERSSHA